MGRGEVFYVAKDSEDFVANIVKRIPRLDTEHDKALLKMAWAAGECAGIQRAREMIRATLTEER